MLYINISSSHPSQVIKQLANSINKRLCENLANAQVFNTENLYMKMLYTRVITKECQILRGNPSVP